MTDAKMKKLAEVNIRPLRIAFDRWGVDPQKPSSEPMHIIYTKAIKLAAKYSINDLSNYLLYNTDDDTPDELYLRMRLNINLCEELNVSIYSFPMKYHPIDNPDYFDNRNFTGKAWNRKYIRAIQAVLNSTHGKIGRGKSFFEAAFGKDLDEFHEILLMPEVFIIERHKYDKTAYQAYLEMGGSKKLKDDDVARCGNMTDEWRARFGSLNPKQREYIIPIIHKNIFDEEIGDISDLAVREVLKYYQIKRFRDIPEVVVDD
jgi:hypothetical protein